MSAPDEPGTAELLAAYFAERVDGFPDPAGYRATVPDPSHFAPPGAFFRVDDETGNPVACGGVRPIGDGRMEVKHLFVVPAARGLGLGRLLVTRMEETARAAGATELVLDTNRSLEAAGGLYASAGFVPIEPYNSNPNATDWYGKPLV